MLTKIIRPIVDYRMDAGKMLSLISRAHLSSNKNKYHAKLYRLPYLQNKRPGIKPSALTPQQSMSIENKVRPPDLAKF